ncbi:hypothetical protein WJX73_008006 [Symbiochloris irregularis]|uniref:RING-type domain-containing protein n=1 Tax=Symbiochloris irregularis TaxID=706552 RepID=A0AAW1P1Y9_9CHLO
MGNVICHALHTERGINLLSKVVEGDVRAAHQMLEEDRRLAVWTNWTDGTSPLHAATSCGHDDLVRDVLFAAQVHLESTRKPKAAAKALKNFVNLRNGVGHTAIELACKHGHSNTLQLLLAVGGKALIQDQVHGRTCLHYAAMFGRAACINVLLNSNVAPNGPLLREAMLDGRSSGKRFVDAPASLGYSALHYAVGHGHTAAATALLRGGADPRARCIGRLWSHYMMPQRFKPCATALHIAAFGRNLAMCIVLLKSQIHLQEEGLEDLRGLRDLCGDRPFDLAQLNSALARLLDPDRNLEEAVTEAEQELRQANTCNVRSLAHLAAEALQARLLQQLDALADAAAPPPSSCNTSFTLLTAPSLGSLAAPLSPQGSQDFGAFQPTPRRKSRSSAERAALGLRGDLDDCEICFVECAGARVGGCGHTMCGECARQVCSLAPAGRVPACPFCRGDIGSFTAAA